MSRKQFFHKDILLDEEEEREFDTEVPEADDYTEEGLDNIIDTNVKLHHNGLTVKANIIKR